jgi:signal peptide peptidase SppA
MRSAIPNILNAFDSAVWAIEETKWLAIREFLYTRSLGKESKIEAGARPTPKIAGRIAVLPLDGCIAHHAGMEMEISGGTSTVAFGKAFDDAVANRDIGAIVIDCNSPGGTVEGVPELAEKIFKARGTKPIYAIANANMNSAAYWICSAADQVFATPSANVGSIGVFTVHTDTSKMEADLGVKRTVISAGKYKSEAAPGVPLTDAAENALQDRVDEVYGMFSSFVAKARGASLKSVQGGFGEGRSISAKQALEAGMIDKIATFEDVGVCPTNADHTAPESVPSPDEGPEARGGARHGESPPPATNRPAPQARSSTVTEEELAALRATDRKAETTRQNELRALCAENDIDDATRDQWLDNGTTVEAASHQIMRIGRERRAASPHVRVGAERETQKPWETFGHFAASVMDAGTPGSTKPVDVRLLGAAQGVNQAIPSEGWLPRPGAVLDEDLGRSLGRCRRSARQTDNYSDRGRVADDERERRDQPRDGFALRRRPGLLDQRSRPDHEVEAEVPRSCASSRRSSRS